MMFLEMFLLAFKPNSDFFFSRLPLRLTTGAQLKSLLVVGASPIISGEVEL
jgi:hypothetical protein